MAALNIYSYSKKYILSINVARFCSVSWKPGIYLILLSYLMTYVCMANRKNYLCQVNAQIWTVIY